MKLEGISFQALLITSSKSLCFYMQILNNFLLILFWKSAQIFSIGLRSGLFGGKSTITVNGLQRKGGKFSHIKTVAKNPVFVQIDHDRRQIKGDVLQNQKKIFPAIFNEKVSWEGPKTVRNGQKLRSPNSANVSSCHKQHPIKKIRFRDV